MPRGETLQVPAERPAGPANFELVLPWPLAGDQPQAATQLTDGLLHGLKDQTLHGVTGSGKTVTMAQVIADAGRPARARAQQDPGGTAVRRVQGVLPEERRPVLRLVLRLLPARGVHRAK